MTNLDSVLKNRDTTFSDKGPYSQSYDFSSCHVWMWELAHKKTDHWRIDAFKLWCWRRLLRFPQTARRSNPSILKDINSKYSLEGLMLKLTSQYYHLMWWADSWIKTLMLWKTEGRRRLSLYGQARTVTALWKYFQVSVQWASSFWKAIFPSMIVFVCVCTESVWGWVLIELAGQDVGLMPSLFYHLGVCSVLLLHGFAAKQAC